MISIQSGENENAEIYEAGRSNCRRLAFTYRRRHYRGGAFGSTVDVWGDYHGGIVLLIIG